MISYPVFQLLLPYGENSPIQGFLDKNKSGGMHHICLEVNYSLSSQIVQHPILYGVSLSLAMEQEF